MDTSLQYTKISYKNFLAKVFKWMFGGLLLTTITSILFLVLGVNRISEINFFTIALVTSIIEITMVILVGKRISNLSMKTAKRYFYVYSIINGITISFLLSLVDPYISILAFALTCSLFGLLYIIATYSSYDFSSIGKTCLSTLPILFIAYLILFFIQAPILFYIIILIDLFVFIGITLYDIQQIEVLYNKASHETIETFAMIGALTLYMDFIDIFIDILIIISDGL
ncbi:MAG: Bax inhibitor-1 family protein [Coprobacillus sp.]